MPKRKIVEDTSPSKRKKVSATDFEPVDPAVLPPDAKLDLADCEIYYVPDFVDKMTAKRWYDELMELDTCKWLILPEHDLANSWEQGTRLVIYGVAMQRLNGQHQPTLKMYGRSFLQSRHVYARPIVRRSQLIDGFRS